METPKERLEAYQAMLATYEEYCSSKTLIQCRAHECPAAIRKICMHKQVKNSTYEELVTIVQAIKEERLNGNKG